jgi:hypothetical protein
MVKCWLELKEPQLVLQACETGVELNPTNAEIRLFHCQSLLAMSGDRSVARQLFAAALECELQSFVILVDTINVLSDAGYTNEATAGYEVMAQLPASETSLSSRRVSRRVQLGNLSVTRGQPRSHDGRRTELPIVDR